MRPIIFRSMLLIGTILTLQIGGSSMRAPIQGTSTTDQKDCVFKMKLGGNIHFTILASRIVTNGDRSHLKGGVNFRTKDMIIYSDEADYDKNTGTLQLYGRVYAQLKGVQDRTFPSTFSPQK
jgi:lipopolysaccharide assembly outer membrane protein LptD (OstA)